ncbi:hypothetical protein AB9K24_09275 [Meridianimaribacter flavus]
MSDHNQKALYFCHTHPNLFLQKNCKSCKLGMCHTCIHNNQEYCPSCTNRFYKLSNSYKNKNEVIRILGFAIVISLAVPLYYYINALSVNSSEFTSHYLLVFYFATSVAATHYMLKGTSFMDSIRKVPFIGFKLSIVILALIVVFGISILYIAIKLINTVLRKSQ